MRLAVVDYDRLADAIVERLVQRGLVPAPPAQHREPPPAKWLKLMEFANRWHMSRAALYDRLGEGLPSTGEGRRRRIPVAEGDAWMVAHGTVQE